MPAAIIISIIIAALPAAYIAVCFHWFKKNMVRDDPEKDEYDHSAPGTQWAPHRALLEKGWALMHGPSSEIVEITSFDGLTLKAFYVPAEIEKPIGICIMFHGFKALATVDFAPEVEFLHNLGYGLIIPYQRSHGLSEGRYITFGTKEKFDALSWAEYAAERFGGDIFLMGISMGCATVLMASDLSLPENVRGIVGDCGISSGWGLWEHVFRKYLRMPKFLACAILWGVELMGRIMAGAGMRENTVDHVKNTRLPILFIHGEKDDFVPVSMTMGNYEVCRGEKELYIAPNADHAMSYSINPEEYARKVEEFFKKHASE